MSPCLVLLGHRGVQCCLRTCGFPGHSHPHRACQAERLLPCKPASSVARGGWREMPAVVAGRGLTAPMARGSVPPCGLAPGAPAGPTPPVPPCAGSCRSPPGLGPQLAVSAPGRRGARLPLALGCPWLRRRSHKSSLGSLCCGCRHSRLGPRHHRGRGLGCLAWEGFLALSALCQECQMGLRAPVVGAARKGHWGGCAVGFRWRAWQCTAVRAGQALRVPSGSTTQGRPLVQGLVGIRGLLPCLRLRGGGLPSCRWLEPDGKSRPS